MPEFGPMDGKDYTPQEIADHLASEDFSSGEEVLAYLKKYGFDLTKGAASEDGMDEGKDEGAEAAGPPKLSMIELRTKAAKGAFPKKKEDDDDEEKE